MVLVMVDIIFQKFLRLSTLRFNHRYYKRKILIQFSCNFLKPIILELHLPKLQLYQTTINSSSKLKWLAHLMLPFKWSTVGRPPSEVKPKTSFKITDLTSS